MAVVMRWSLKWVNLVLQSNRFYPFLCIGFPLGWGWGWLAINLDNLLVDLGLRYLLLSLSLSILFVFKL
ncbi:hypothetical protein BGX38DRAFT_1222105, partial [Terfezia claveryi]